MLEAGLPDGLVNIMTMSHDVARTMCTHPAVGMITLTGSVSAGQTVLDYCKTNIAKPSLELGGKSPVIVEPDADLDAVARMVLGAKTAHCGQVCTSAERLYVHRSIHDALVEKLRQGFAARRFGDRAIDPEMMGPLANAAARARIHGMVERAVAEGATVIAGGAIPDGEGYFYPPTLMTGCRQEMEIVREEVFGPVLAVLSYETFDEALALASDHQFGLASVLFSENYRKVMQAASEDRSRRALRQPFPGRSLPGLSCGLEEIRARRR